ncbi:MAG: DUF1932 domain-containing protein [Phyllobacteriaceae bacterium]|nr:DUF1932 domain-containing protein [Phyllobacteriaceae bacterium]
MAPGAIALIGFGEAAAAFVAGWREDFPALSPRAFDIKTDSATQRDSKLADYARAGVAGAMTAAEALSGATIVFSLVTADQAGSAARAAAAALRAGALFFDGNSCSPGTKAQSAAVIEAAGGRYVDVAIMAPVHPKGSKTPLLFAGPHADAALSALSALRMQAEPVTGGVGAASSIKMIRSVMIKGLEALVAECMLAGRRAGVADTVLETLDQTFPGFGWKQRSAYMLERAMTHGVRRAAEMREVAATIEELGLPPSMATSTVAWQQAIGDLRLDARSVGESLEARADAILAALAATRGAGGAP